MKYIKLTRGYFTKVDDEDFEKFSVYKWFPFAAKNSTLVRVGRQKYLHGNRETLYLHRLIVNAPKGTDVDHINGDDLDNRKSNLRICSHKQNLHNSKIPITNTSGYKGVSYSSESYRKKRWIARLMESGKLIYQGRFLTKKEAVLAYNEAALKYHGEFARLNKLA